jgi:hypothetical protein
MAGMPLRPADDITLVVLRRLPERLAQPVVATLQRPQLQTANEPRPLRR